MFMESYNPNSYRDPENYIEHIYTHRALKRFMVYFGLVDYQLGKRYDHDSFVVKTEFFDQFISIDTKKVVSIF